MKEGIIFICLCLNTIACTDHDAETTALREQLVAEGVKIKVNDFRDREWAKCVERARNEAVIQVDSIIRAMAKQSPVEPVIKPPKPERPGKPETKQIPDSIRAKAKRDSIEQKDNR